MTELEVTIVNLPPMRVACINGFGTEPEDQAWKKMIAWAKGKGLWKDGKPKRFFGYNNPNPSAGSPNYGYDMWMTVDESVQTDETARVFTFPGGLYAVTPCPVKNPAEDIGAAWQKLVAWTERSKYRHAGHQWLEEHIDPEHPAEGVAFTLALFMPIKE